MCFNKERTEEDALRKKAKRFSEDLSGDIQRRLSLEDLVTVFALIEV